MTDCVDQSIQTLRGQLNLIIFNLRTEPASRDKYEKILEMMKNLQYLRITVNRSVRSQSHKSKCIPRIWVTDAIFYDHYYFRYCPKRCVHSSPAPSSSRWSSMSHEGEIYFNKNDKKRKKGFDWSGTTSKKEWISNIFKYCISWLLSQISPLVKSQNFWKSTKSSKAALNSAIDKTELIVPGTPKRIKSFGKGTKKVFNNIKSKI